MIKVLTVDDHHIIQAAIQNWLVDDPDIEVIGSVDSGEKALDFIKDHLETDIVLMDINMPGMDGIEATKFITKRYDQVKVMMLTMEVSYDMVKKAVNAGANGFLTKLEVSPELLSQAIKDVRCGNGYFSPFASRSIIDEMRKQASLWFMPDSRVISHTIRQMLSEKEHHVLSMLAEGKTTDEIATELNISRRTVEVHKSNMQKKVGARNVVDLVIRGLRLGLIELGTTD